MQLSNAYLLNLHQNEMVARLRRQNIRPRVIKTVIGGVFDSGSAQGYFSYSRDGVHGLKHYIETRLVYPMGPVVDPVDQNSLRCYYSWESGGYSTPLSDVIKRLKQWEQAGEDLFFEDAAANLEPVGEVTSVQRGDKIYFRDRF